MKQAIIQSDLFNPNLSGIYSLADGNLRGYVEKKVKLFLSKPLGNREVKFGTMQAAINYIFCFEPKKAETKPQMNDRQFKILMELTEEKNKKYIPGNPYENK